MPTRFADIPKTPAIEDLPATASGMPIPYTTLYLDKEGNDPTDLVRLPNGGGLILRCSCKFDVGRPRFGKPCPYRQRKAMMERRCVVCGRNIKLGRPVIFLGVSRNRPDGVGDPMWTSIEPPAHAPCAAYSALACPRLAARPEDVLVATSRTYDIWKHIVLSFDGDGQAVGPIVPMTTPVVTGAVDIYIAVPHRRNTTVVPVTEWLARYAPAPYRGMSTVECQ